MQVPTKQFLDQLIELRQDLIAVWFGHNGLSLDVNVPSLFSCVMM